MVTLEFAKPDPLKYRIKIAGPSDNLLPIVKKSHEDSPWAEYPITDAELNTIIGEYVTDPLSKIAVLLCYEGRPVGLLAAFVGHNHPLLRSKKIAYEMIWYVEPEHRGKYSTKLIDAYEHWALHVVNADMIHISNYSDQAIIDRLYQRRGFVSVEKSFMKIVRT